MPDLNYPQIIARAEVFFIENEGSEKFYCLARGRELIGILLMRRFKEEKDKEICRRVRLNSKGKNKTRVFYVTREAFQSQKGDCDRSGRYSSFNFTSF